MDLDLLKTLLAIQQQYPRGATNIANQLNQYRTEQKTREQALQDIFSKAIIEQKVKQLDPMYQFIQKAEMATKLKAMSDLGADISPYKGLFGGGTATPTDVIDTTGKVVGEPTIPQGNAIMPTNKNLTPTSYERTAFGEIRPTKFEDVEGDITRKAREQSVVAAEKEKQVNIGKVRRLNQIANIVEKKWLETQPHKGLRGRIGGLASIPISSFQATKGQQTDYAYRAFVKGMRAQLARAMGDVGNLSEPEQKAAMDLVPKLEDSLEVGQRKIQTIKDFVATIEAGNIEKAREIISQNNISSFQEGQTATNSKTGEQIIYRGGQWQKK